MTADERGPMCPSWKRRKVEKDEEKKEEVRKGVGKGRERWRLTLKPEDRESGEG